MPLRALVMRMLIIMFPRYLSSLTSVTSAIDALRRRLAPAKPAPRGRRRALQRHYFKSAPLPPLFVAQRETIDASHFIDIGRRIYKMINCIDDDLPYRIRAKSNAALRAWAQTYDDNDD